MTTNRTMLQNLGNDNKGGGKKEENGGKRSPIFRRKIKLAAKDDKKRFMREHIQKKNHSVALNARKKCHARPLELA